MVESGIKVIKGGRLIDGTGAAPVDNGMVLIENTKIKAIGQDIPVPDGAHVIDATSKTVMPGLIDAHMHCNGPRPEDTFHDTISRPRELRLIKAINDTRDCLLSGFTTVKSCGGMNGIYLKRAVSEGSLNKMPRLFSTSYMLTSTIGNPHPYMPEEYVDARKSKHDGHPGGLCVFCDGLDECIKATRYAITRGADFVKIFARGGSCFNQEELQAIVRTSADVDKFVSIHTENSEIAERAIIAGVKTIDHATGVEDRVVEMGNKAGVIFVSTLVCLEAIIKCGPGAGRSVQELEWAKRFLEVSCMTYKMIRREGGTMAIGTDYGGESLVRELGGSAIELELLVKYCDFTPMEAIVSATKNAAKACFLEEQTGTIEKGKWADLLVIDGNPLEDITILQQKEKIKMVMLEGKVEIER